MDDDQSMEDIPWDLENPRMPSYKKYFEIHRNTAYWYNIDTLQSSLKKKDFFIFSNTITRNRLNHTLFAFCIEKAVCMKDNEE